MPNPDPAYALFHCIFYQNLKKYFSLRSRSFDSVIDYEKGEVKLPK